MGLKWSNILLHIDDFINSWINIKLEYELHIIEINEEIDEKAIGNDNLQEIVTFLEVKLLPLRIKLLSINNKVKRSKLTY
jgi:hypothetical protein